MSVEIEFISTTELTEELVKRFDAIIIYGIQKDLKGNNVSNYYDHFKGDQPTCLGLCDLLKEKIKEDFKDRTIRGLEDA